mmetsp:Transcript_17348/g.44451  ORF Transcript_17348/g.44451 Transcript_17348/m.44451 type:complete len:456 (-) Transcript_17348:906-2273(-)
METFTPNDRQCVVDIYDAVTPAEKERSNNDVFLLLIGGMLVFFMQAGFAMLEVGHVRLKNRKNMLLKNVTDACVGGVVWYLLGYAFAFGPSSNGFIGGDWSYFTGCADYAHLFFQWSFASTATTIISGAIAERCTVHAYLALSTLMPGWIYPVVVHWAWSGTGWLDASVVGGAGLLDFAGAGVVHLTGGTAALMGAYLIGPRTGRFSNNQVWALKTYSHALTTLGTFILWFCWYAFNCFSTQLYSQMYVSSRIAVNTTLGACGGGLGGLLLNFIVQGNPDISPALNGILGGLVSITSGCAYFEPYIALIVGFLGGCLVYLGSWGLRSVKIDDALDAAPVHMMCGAWGLLATGLLASPKFISGPYYGCFYGGSAVQLGIQVAGMLAIFIWSACFSGAFFFVFKRRGWLRVGFDEEISGLDKLMTDGELERDTAQQFQPAAYMNQTGYHSNERMDAA